MGHDENHGHSHASGHGHGHSHTPSLGEMRAEQRTRLWWVLVVNASMLVLEVVGGIMTNSLALLADAVHLATDVTGLGVALIAHTLMTREATHRHTYGLQRVEVLGAQINGLLLVGGSVWIVFAASSRLGGDTQEIDGGPMAIIAFVGLLANVWGAWVLARVQGDSLNMRGAVVHLIADAVGSVVALGAGVAALTAGAHWLDPVASILIAVLVVVAAWSLIRDATNVLLEGVPQGLDIAAIEKHLGAVGEVASVHHLHVWSLASDTVALSAHVVLDGEYTLHEAQQRSAQLRNTLQQQFGIGHVTLEIECHPCEAEEDSGSPC